MKLHLAFAWLVAVSFWDIDRGLVAQEVGTLPGTLPLRQAGDLSAQMVEGIHTFLAREIERSATNRNKFWQRDFGSEEAYGRSVSLQREDFQRMIGAVD